MIIISKVWHRLLNRMRPTSLVWGILESLRSEVKIEGHDSFVGEFFVPCLPCKKSWSVIYAMSVSVPRGKKCEPSRALSKIPSRSQIFLTLHDVHMHPRKSSDQLRGKFYLYYGKMRAPKGTPIGVTNVFP